MYRAVPTGVKKYILGDAITAYLGWLTFFIIRKTQVEHQIFDFSAYISDFNFFIGGIIVSLYWLYIYALSNTYKSLYTKSRLAEILRTFIQSFIGCLFLSIVVVLDDLVGSYRDYYYLMLVMISVHFVPTLFVRLLFLFRAKSHLKSGKISFPTLIIGSHRDLKKIYQDVSRLHPLQGIDVREILTNIKEIANISVPIQNYHLSNLKDLLKNTSYTHAVLALSKEERNHISTYISILDSLGIRIKIIPELSESLTSKAKIDNPLGTALIDINTEVMTPFQKLIKKTFDLSVSATALIVLSPALLGIALLIKRNSPGPALYKQERIGQYGKSFTIYKFRSMHVGAESNGPQLSKEGDDRTTSIGHILRKFRIDELPQFYNVLNGSMSLIGPRPERKYFAEQIIERVPEYKYIYKMKPGITSWGMVRFGYASNVDEMVERMEYDLLYVNNFSLLMDFRIFIYTIITVIRGKGL